jgi:hypothetical protein
MNFEGRAHESRVRGTRKSKDVAHGFRWWRGARVKSDFVLVPAVRVSGESVRRVLAINVRVTGMLWNPRHCGRRVAPPRGTSDGELS